MSYALSSYSSSSVPRVQPVPILSAATTLLKREDHLGDGYTCIPEPPSTSSLGPLPLPSHSLLGQRVEGGSVLSPEGGVV